MRYIQKDYTTAAVQIHKAELRAKLLDEQSLLNPATHNGLSGKKLYKLVRDIKVIPHFWNLKRQMLEEQGGICCYCGLKISFSGNRKPSVEHLSPKGTHRELVGEYKNLLLSCSLTTDEESEIKSGQTIETDIQHCNDTKGDKLLHYTPLQPDCGKYFAYDIYGYVAGIDADSEADIQTLNLDCKALVDRRKAAMSILFDENNDFISDNELQQIANTIMNRQTDGDFREFCFVIKSVIDNLTKQP